MNQINEIELLLNNKHQPVDIDILLDGFRELLKNCSTISHDEDGFLDLVMWTVYLVNEISVIPKKEKFYSEIIDKLQTTNQKWKTFF